MQQNLPVLIKWAGIHALMYLAWMLMERLAGFHSTRLEQLPLVGALIMLPSLAIYALALLDLKRKCYENRLTWRQGFVGGCLFTVFIVAVSPLNLLITTSIISPDYFANLTEFTVNQGILTPAEAAGQFNLGYYIGTSIVAGLVIGALFSAGVAFVIRSRGVTP